MKVYLGPYRRYIGLYQLCSWVTKFGVSDDKLLEFLAKLPYKDKIDKFFDAIHDRFFQRKIEVRIDSYDTWSSDHSLALIILPLLKKLRESKQGTPFVNPADCPDELKPSAEDNEKMTRNPGYVDEHFDARWEYVIGEMIYAFGAIVDEDHDSQFYTEKDPESEDVDGLESLVSSSYHIDFDAREIDQQRIQTGLILFGKYFQNLWS